MATGTGKTYTAFQIVYRLLQSGMKRKILYLADRNILVDQSIQQDFAPLEKVIHKINVAKDDRSTITSHEVYFSLYQQLVGDDDDQEHFSASCSPRTSLISSSWTSVTAAPPKKRAVGAASWNTSVPPRRSA